MNREIDNSCWSPWKTCIKNHFVSDGCNAMGDLSNFQEEEMAWHEKEQQKGREDEYKNEDFSAIASVQC